MAENQSDDRWLLVSTEPNERHEFDSKAELDAWLRKRHPNRVVEMTPDGDGGGYWADDAQYLQYHIPLADGSKRTLGSLGVFMKMARTDLTQVVEPRDGWDKWCNKAAEAANAEAAEFNRPKGFQVSVSYKAAHDGLQSHDAKLLALAGRVADHSGYSGGVRECQWEEPTMEAASGMRRRLESTGEFHANVQEL